MAHSSLKRHSKLLDLVNRLRRSRPEAVGLLEHLWWAVYDTPSIGRDGVLPGWDDREIAQSARWDGDPTVFVAALVDAGFLDRVQTMSGQCPDNVNRDTYAIHDYADWAPTFVKKRWARKEGSDPPKKAPRKRKTAICPDNVQTMSRQCPDSVLPTQPNPTQCKKTTSSLPAAPAQRPRDPIFDAVVECCFPSLVGAKLTGRQGKHIGAIAADLKKCKATPEQIRQKWAIVQAKVEAGDWSEASPHVLVTRWDTLTAPRPAGSKGGDDFDKLYREASRG